MAEFRFAVHKEHLDLLTPTKGRSDDLNTTSCVFNFRTPDWEGASKWAHFINYDINDGQPYDFALINDRIPPENGLNLPPGVWDVYVHGEVIVGTQVIGRITTNPVAIVIDVPNDTDGDPLAPIGPTVAEQIDGKATAALNARITSATAEIDNAVGVPSVTVNITGADGDKSLGFVFHNMKGEQGDQGPIGPVGPQGPQGEQGIRGETGITPDFSIGTVDGGDTAAATITGTAEAPVLNLVLPKGDKGDTGQTGQTGATGATPELSIGTVTGGDTAAATMTGTAEEPVLNLVLPKGDKGDTGQTGQTGATPDISIGTVTGGDTAAATITGTAEAPVLNLVLPKGDKGDTGQTGQTGATGATGATPDISIGTVSTGAAGSSVTVTITGTAEEPVLNFSIPKGDTGATGQTGQTGATGATGATPELSIGTVSTGAAGSSVTVTITGTAEEPVLNFSIPKGDTGATGQTGATGATPDISIGTVTSGSTASATMTGTAAEPVLNLVLPKGDTGPQGPKGDPGDVQSVNGKTGAVTLSTSDLNNDSGFITGMVILSYGNSTWQNFIDAYSANKVVYCRASSNANPASGSQNRLAFMAYVNSESPSSITTVEFQYYRSVSSHSATQQGDQVFVYQLSKTSGWSVVTREASSKIVAGTDMDSSYSSGVLTLNFAGTIPSTAADVGAIPAPDSPASGAFLVWDGSAWVAQTLSTWQGGSY